MQNLRCFVETENSWATLRGNEPIDVDNLTDAQATHLFYRLDCEMSPEHLHCDGEITAEQAQEKAKLFLGAASDLVHLGFSKPNDLWCL